MTIVTYYVGLDVSVKMTAVCVIDDAGQAVIERVVVSDPGDIGKCVAEIGEGISRVGLEAGPLAPWLFLADWLNAAFLSSASRSAR